MPARFSAKDVVDCLDKCIIDEPYCFFMDLQHGYFHTANSRLTLYADESRWAIVFETNGYANRGGRIDLDLNFFGNCLRNLDRAGADDRYVCNAKWSVLVDGGASGFEWVSPSATSVKVRGTPVPLPLTKAGYAKWVPDIHDDSVFAERPTLGMGPGERCNQASLHNRRQMGEQNGSVGNAPLKPAPIVTPPPKTRSRYGIAQIEPPQPNQKSNKIGHF
jgi:uncharacterized protein DUF7003